MKRARLTYLTASLAPINIWRYGYTSKRSIKQIDITKNSSDQQELQLNTSINIIYNKNIAQNYSFCKMLGFNLHYQIKKLINAKRILLLFSILPGFISNNIMAADRVYIDTNSSNSFMSSQALIKLNSLDSAYKFKTVKQIKLPNGKIKIKQTQLYNNIPVWNNNIIREQNNNSFVLNNNIKGSYLINIEQDINSTTPNISEDVALNKAIYNFNENYNLINNIKPQNINIKLIIKSYDNIAKLVYVVDYFIDDVSLDKPKRPYSIIDAKTGAVLESWDGLTSQNYVNATGPGGNGKTGKYYYGTDYGYLTVREENGECYMDSPNVKTYDYQNDPDYGGRGAGGVLHKFSCSENTYKEINGAYSPINDAHYFGNIVYDMYKSWYDASPLTHELILKAHYKTNHNNAYWTGSVMLFGDGDGYRTYPFVSLDVVGHEVSHGFTQQNSDLVYQNQSGGMNESFSDIAGEATQYFMNKDKPESERNDWLVGPEIFRADNALRYFADPTRDNYSIDHVDNYDPYNNEVHSTSGIFNKAFYTLAVKQGWGLRQAFDAFVLANKVYWTQNSTFDEGGCGVKNAAADLGLEFNDVIAAFKVVGVDATCGISEPDPNPNPDPTPDPDPTPTPDPDHDPNGAEKLTSGQYVNNLSAWPGETKLFYIDVPVSATNSLATYLSGNLLGPNMKVAYNRVPSSSDYDCSSIGGDYGSPCVIYRPKQGRYYIEVSSVIGFFGVNLWSMYL